mmetsp:Transcript_15122/g.30713  ORF Transcript_15122/g.30713 Transcript_15122/m.30713 type:complete len:117 (-) Transcript_15122:522-872(-)
MWVAFSFSWGGSGCVPHSLRTYRRFCGRSAIGEVSRTQVLAREEGSAGQRGAVILDGRQNVAVNYSSRPRQAGMTTTMERSLLGDTVSSIALGRSANSMRRIHEVSFVVLIASAAS